MIDVTHILSQFEQRDQKAAAQLLPPVYDELRQLGERGVIDRLDPFTFASRGAAFPQPLHFAERLDHRGRNQLLRNTPTENPPSAMAVAVDRSARQPAVDPPLTQGLERQVAEFGRGDRAVMQPQGLHRGVDRVNLTAGRTVRGAIVSDRVPLKRAAECNGVELLQTK
jgi:hypothetical protein